MALIHEKMAEVMKDMVAIGKEKRNQQQGFNYRGIDDVYNLIQPLLARHGIFIRPMKIVDTRREERINQKGTVLAFVSTTIQYAFVAADGSEVVMEMIGEGMDSGDKATSKSLSMAQKYLIFQTFMPPLDEKYIEDGDRETHVVVKNPEPDVVAKKPEPALVWSDEVKEAIQNSIRQLTDEDSVRKYFIDIRAKANLRDPANADALAILTKACNDRVVELKGLAELKAAAGVETKEAA